MSTPSSDVGVQAKSAMNTVVEVKAAIRGFILRSIALAELGDDDNLFESGIANSLFAVQLMTFIEKTFALEVEMEDLEIANFKSVNAATAFVMRKNGRGQ